MVSKIESPNLKTITLTTTERIDINNRENGYFTFSENEIPSGYQPIAVRIPSYGLPTRTHFVPWLSDYNGNYRVNFYNIVGQNSYLPSGTDIKILCVK